MKKLKYLFTLAVAVLMVPLAVFSAPSPTIDAAKLYQVKNQTQSGNWNTSVTASSGQTIAMLVHLHNGIVDSTATNVRARATLPAGVISSYTSTATVSADNAASASGTIGINLTAPATLTYVPGSTVLYNHSGQVEANLPDGITTTGITALLSQKGCWEYEKWVRFEVRVSSAPEQAACAFSAGPSTLTKGDSSTLTYTTTNARSASIDHGIGSVPVPNGTVRVTPDTDTVYTLTAVGDQNIAICTTTVTVRDNPTPPPVTPPTTIVTTSKGNLPETGPVEAAAGAVGLTATGGAAYAWMRSKKALLSAVTKIK